MIVRYDILQLMLAGNGSWFFSGISQENISYGVVGGRNIKEIPDIAFSWKLGHPAGTQSVCVSG